MNTSVNAAESLLFITLLQLIVMVGAARFMHTVFRRIGQPGVVGEIFAGLILGPSLLGHFFPQLSLSLFGQHASQPITIISQIGLILLMFQIGMDFEFGHLDSRRNRNATIAVTLFSISVPLAIGILVGRLSAAALAPAIDPVRYSLFLGLGMAITAVPILGRILRQYGLTHTEVGVVAISAAAVNDVIGWLLLSMVSAYAASQFSVGHVALQFDGLLGFVLLLWFVLRPLVNRLIARFPARTGELNPNLMAIVVCLIFALGICTYRLGIFAILGGFAGGVLFHPQPIRHLGHADEYPCADGIDCSQHRLRSGADPAEGIHHAGDHGGRHDADGGAAAETALVAQRSSHPFWTGSLKVEALHAT